MIALLWSLAKLRWRRFWCSHPSHMRQAPEMALHRALLEGSITIEEYRDAEHLPPVTECLRCGRTWVG